MTAQGNPITRAASLAADSPGRLIRRAAQGNAEAVAEVVSLPADLRGLGHPFEVLVGIVKRMDADRVPITEDAVLEAVIRLNESGIAPVLLDPLTPPTQSPALCAGDVRNFLRAVERDALAGELRRPDTRPDRAQPCEPWPICGAARGRPCRRKGPSPQTRPALVGGAHHGND